MSDDQTRVSNPSPAALAKAREIVRDNTFVDRIHWELIPEIALALDAWRAQALEEAMQIADVGNPEHTLGQGFAANFIAKRIRALAPPATLKESERRLLDESRARVAVLEGALSEVGRVLNAEHTAISGIDAIGLASVNAILHRLGRICDDALAPATPETGDGQ